MPGLCSTTSGRSTPTVASPTPAGRCPSSPCTRAWPAWSPPAPTSVSAPSPAPSRRCSRSATCCAAPPDELPTNIVDRLRLVDGTNTDHPRLDRSALHLVRRRAGELARRAGIERRDRGSTDPMTAAGLALAFAYPDRVAQARGNGRFRMRHGAGAWLPEGDALTGEAFLVVAELAADARVEYWCADHRILMAAALDESDLELAAGDGVERITTLAWDPGRDDLRVRTERRLGDLVLASTEGPPEPGDATAAALLDR